MIAVVGASGFIGSHIYAHLLAAGENVIGSYHKNKPGANHHLQYFDLLQNDYALFENCSTVIIASAIPRLEECALNQQHAHSINVTGTINLINHLAARSIKVIFISSDQVFDGSKGNYVETDTPKPINAYGKMKYEVEQHISLNIKNSLILRLSKVYSYNPNHKSIYTDIYHSLVTNTPIKAATNQVYNPTHIDDAVKWIRKLHDRNTSGTYHIASPAIKSRYDFAVEIAKRHHVNPELVIPIDLMSLDLVDYPGKNTSLNTTKLINMLKH